MLIPHAWRVVVREASTTQYTTYATVNVLKRSTRCLSTHTNTPEGAEVKLVPLQSAEKMLVLPYIRAFGATSRLWFRRFADGTTPHHELLDSTSGSLLSQARQAGGTHGNAAGVTATRTPTELRVPLLRGKRMFQSHITRFLPIKSNPDCLEEFVNPWGAVRMGKIFEELDALSGSIACLHADVGVADAAAPENAITIVTACLDRITMFRPVTANMDLQLSGYVFWVGSSSMMAHVTVNEVSNPDDIPRDPLADMHASDGLYVDDRPNDAFLPDPDDETPHPTTGKGPVLSAVVTMVTRDQVTGKATPVNQLDVVTRREEALFNKGLRHREQLKLLNKTQQYLKLPTVDDYQHIQDIVNSTAADPLALVGGGHHPVPASPTTAANGAITTNASIAILHSADTVQHSLQIMMPQERNIHGNVFGGYLLRAAYELAHGTGLQFVPLLEFISLDDTVFQKPVKIGSLLHLESEIVYSEECRFLIRVQADVTFPPTAVGAPTKRETTNVFHFTFRAMDKNRSQLKVPVVIPSNLLSLSRWVDGKRQMRNSGF